MPNVGPMELVIVLVIALLVLGPKKLPEVGKSLGKGLREFKDSVSGITGGDDDEKDPFGQRQVQARHDDAPVPAPEPRTEPDVHPDPEAPAPKSETVS